MQPRQHIVKRLCVCEQGVQCKKVNKARDEDDAAIERLDSLDERTQLASIEVVRS